jgi:hypothetical protein
MLSIVKKHTPACVGLFLVVAILVVSATFFTASHAAAPTKAWNIAGQGVSSSGTVIFNNRSVQIGGKVSASKGCATIFFAPETSKVALSSDSRTVCNGTRSFGFTLPANVRGGASLVFVDLGKQGVQFAVGTAVLDR